MSVLKNWWCVFDDLTGIILNNNNKFCLYSISICITFKPVHWLVPVCVFPYSAASLGALVVYLFESNSWIWNAPIVLSMKNAPFAIPPYRNVMVSTPLKIIGGITSRTLFFGWNIFPALTWRLAAFRLRYDLLATFLVWHIFWEYI